MKIGKEIPWNWFEGGGFIIRRTEIGYELYETPRYGGEETYINTFSTLEGAKIESEKLT